VADPLPPRAANRCENVPRVILIGGKSEAAIRQTWRLGHLM
jgi:hypothetical protein